MTQRFRKRVVTAVAYLGLLISLLIGWNYAFRITRWYEYPVQTALYTAWKEGDATVQLKDVTPFAWSSVCGINMSARFRSMLDAPLPKVVTSFADATDQLSDYESWWLVFIQNGEAVKAVRLSLHDAPFMPGTPPCGNRDSAYLQRVPGNNPFKLNPRFTLKN